MRRRWIVEAQFLVDADDADQASREVWGAIEYSSENNNVVRAEVSECLPYGPVPRPECEACGTDLFYEHGEWFHYGVPGPEVTHEAYPRCDDADDRERIEYATGGRDHAERE